MGLDIIVYSKLEHQRDERVEQVMESLFSPLGEEVIEITEGEENLRCSDMAIGKWHRTDDTKVTHFRAGSYSGYNQFRNLLAQAFHGVDAEEIWSDENSFEGTPFYEMINFSDCDGVFGPTDSAKLYQDFEEGEDDFVDFVGEHFEDDDEAEIFLEVYREFKEGFELAADEGILIYC